MNCFFSDRKFNHLFLSFWTLFLAGSLGLSGCSLGESSGVQSQSRSANASSVQAAAGGAPASQAQTVSTADSTILRTVNPDTEDPPACREASGKTSRERIQSSILPGELDYTIYLPPCYTENVEERYPVIYLFHGISYTDTQWVDLGITRAADEMIRDGEIPPVILVFPYNYDWRQPDESQFGNAIAGSLVPAIDQTYRTVADRDHRAVGGLSRGAGWAVHLGLVHGDLFSRVGAHSLSVLRVDESHLDEWISEIPADQAPVFYLDAGKGDPELETIEKFAASLSQGGISSELHIQAGDHDESYWSAHARDYLAWYTADW